MLRRQSGSTLVTSFCYCFQCGSRASLHGCVCVCELDVWSCARLGSCQKSTQTSTLRSDKNTSSHTDIHTHTHTHAYKVSLWTHVENVKKQATCCVQGLLPHPLPPQPPPYVSTYASACIQIFFYKFTTHTPPAESFPPKRAKKVAKPLKPFDSCFLFLTARQLPTILAKAFIDFYGRRL